MPTTTHPRPTLRLPPGRLAPARPRLVKRLHQGALQNPPVPQHP
jgi:hypothetical protein